MSQLPMTTRKKLSHLLPRSRHHHHAHSTSIDGVSSVHQKNFKQRLIALIKKFRTDGSDFGNEEQYREALERELLKVAASRGPTAIEELLEEEDIEAEEESSLELDGLDNQQSPHLSSQGSSLRLEIEPQQQPDQQYPNQQQQASQLQTSNQPQTSQQQLQLSVSPSQNCPQTSQQLQQQHTQLQQQTQNDDLKDRKNDAQQSKKKSSKRHSHLPISQLPTTTRKKLSHLIPRSHHHHRSKTIDGVSSVHQKNFKQKLVALIKKFRTDGSSFDNEEQYREALERELLRVATGRSSRAIEELLEEEIDAEEESGSEVDGWDNISETSTPKPSLRPFFSSTTLDKI